MQRLGRTTIAASLFAGLCTLTGTALADHQELGSIEPSEQEQLGIYELNRARSNPAAYGQEIGFDLSGITPQPALAVNKNLTGSARFHAFEMLDHHYFGHTSDVTGIGPNQMAVDNGYDLFGIGLEQNSGAANTIESNAFGYNQTRTYPEALSSLIIDKDVAGAGHRVHLLATNPQFQSHREIGSGFAEGLDSFPEFNLPNERPTFLYSIHTANMNPDDTFITGVAYEDRNGNLRYDAAEGLGGVTVSANGSEVATMANGGYSIQVEPGTYTVTCAGGGFQGTATLQVGVLDANVSVNCQSDVPVGELNHGWQFGAGIEFNPPLPPVSTDPPDLTGTITQFKHVVKETGDKLVVKVKVENIGSGPANHPFTVALWVSDNDTFDEAATKLTETLIEDANIAPGASMKTKFKLSDQPAITEKFAFVTIDDGNAIEETDETNNALLSTATVDGCAAITIYRDQEPNFQDNPQSIGKIKVDECVRVIGMSDTESVDSFRLTVKGTQSLELTLLQDPEPSISLAVLDVDIKIQLPNCFLSGVVCELEASGAEPPTLNVFDLTTRPANSRGPGGEYVFDIVGKPAE